MCWSHFSLKTLAIRCSVRGKKHKLWHSDWVLAGLTWPSQLDLSHPYPVTPFQKTKTTSIYMNCHYRAKFKIDNEIQALPTLSSVLIVTPLSVVISALTFCSCSVLLIVSATEQPILCFLLTQVSTYPVYVNSNMMCVFRVYKDNFWSRANMLDGEPIWE